MKNPHLIKHPESLLNRFNLFLLVLFLWCLPASLPAALIAYWNFDEGSGTVARDTSGVTSPHDGTLAVQGSGSLPQWIPGRFGYALDFNRVNDSNGSRVTVPFQNDLWLNDAFTISFWYRPGPNIGSFPGPMRIGSQSATSGSNIGWGFFRASSGNRLTFKRGNAQPNMYPPALVNGTWYHVVLRHDGVNQNTAIIFGLTTNTTTQAWLDATATTVFEFGRMDQMDDCDLDDVAFFNEALPLERIYSINSVPTKLGVDYSLADVRALWNLFDQGPGSSAIIRGREWRYTTEIPGNPIPGDAFLSGTQWYVVLAPGAGVTATATVYGDFSPQGVGVPGTTSFPQTPDIAPTARLVFDLSGTVEPGVNNDLIEVQGDLVLSNQTVVINPLMPLTNGTYHLIHYSGSKIGNLNPVVLHQSRYQMTLDESEAGMIKLVVSGTHASLQWLGNANNQWNLSTANWSNLISQTSDVFQQADEVRFDDTVTSTTNIVLNGQLFPSAVMIASSTKNFSFSGSGALGGMTAGLVKSGASTLTLGTANFFQGPVVVNEGILKLGHPSALGLTTQGTVIGAGAMLDLAGNSPGAEPIIVSGAGINGIGAILNSGNSLINNGLRGVVTLQGDTTLGGTNRFDIYGGSLIGNGHRLTKIGPSEVALAQLGETGLGEVDVLGGQLTILGNTQLGTPDQRLYVGPGATLAFWAAGTNVITKNLQVEGGRLLNATTPTTDIATLTGTLRLSGTNVVEGGSSLDVQGDISGQGRLNKNGAGTLTFGGADTFSGAIYVNGGRLTLGGGASLAGVTNLFLGNGTVLDVSSLRAAANYSVPAGQTLMGSGAVHGSLSVGDRGQVQPGASAGTLTVTNHLNLGEGATLVLELGRSTVEGGGTNDLIQVNGDLNISGVVTIKIIPLAPLETTDFYTLINFGGAINGNVANLQIVSDSRYDFLLDTSVPGKVRLLATGAGQTLTWQGNDPVSPNLWDVRETPNWSGAERFHSGDTVVFDDTGATNQVELVGELYPTLLRVEANVLEYLFAGSGRIRGGDLTKSLNGRLTIANSGINDFPGTVSILGGEIQVGTGGSFGNLGPGPIVNQATLILNRSDDLTWANTMTGSGTFVKANTNTLFLGASMAGFDGTIIARGGRLRPTAASGLGTATGGTVLEAGASLEINGINFGAEPFTIAGAGPDGNGVLVNSGGGQNNALRFVTLSGDATVNSIGRFDVRANPDAALVGNGFALTKLGANQFSLVSAGDTGLGDILTLQGTLSVEGNTYLGSNGVLLVTNGATVMFWGSAAAQDKAFALGNGGRLFKDNGTATMRGPGFITGSNTVEAASNSGTDFTLAGGISGDGMLNKLGAGNVFLTAENQYTGGTLVSAGNLFIGNGGGSGSVAGDITVNSTLYFWRTNEFVLTNNIRGIGNVYVRTPLGGAMILDGSAQLQIDQSLEVGRDIYGKLIIRDGARPVVGRINLGNVSGTVGEAVQEGGDVFVTLEMRVGHWPNNTSHYILGGGTLNITNIPTGVVNPNAVAEQNGILYLGIDGTGIFTQTGGVATAHGIVLDGRGDTAGTDTFNLEGGVFRLGSSGLKSGNLDNNTSYLINLGGGTLAAWQSWTSVLAMTLTGTNGDVTIDTDVHTVQLTGLLSGPGGLRKAGEGTLVLAGQNTYTGLTTVGAGVLRAAGALAGTVVVDQGSTLEVGTGITTLALAQDLNLAGTLSLDINKTSGLLTNDRITGVVTQYLGGTLRVTASGDALAEGDTFDLFDAQAFVGSFTTLELPPLPDGLTWDTSNLAVDGTIRVAQALPPTPPVFAAPAREGNNLVLSGTGGRPGANYRVLATDNISLPLAQWTEVAVGQFGPNGEFNQSLPIPAEPSQRYYIIVYP